MKVKNLTFIQLQKGSEAHYKLFENLMIPYNKELAQVMVLPEKVIPLKRLCIKRIIE